MFKFCQNEIKGIKFYYIPQEDLEHVRRNLAQRLNGAKTVPGTRGFHQFVPLDISTIAAKRVSEDSEYALQFSFSGKKSATIQGRIVEFIVCLYDEKLWVGMVSDIKLDMEDVEVKFMHPHLPTNYLRWPNLEDLCWVPNLNVCAQVKPAELLTMTGRHYCLDKEDRMRIEKLASN